MQEGKRQKQVASVIQEAMNDIFRRLSLHMMDGGMLSISSIKVTPDLLEARIYISMLQVEQPKLAMKKIDDRAWEIKKELSARVKTQFRRIPVLHFYYDDTLDYVFKMEEVFSNLKKEGLQNDNADNTDATVNE